MTSVLVIGYGNPLRGDDGAGRLVAGALYDAWPESRVRVEASHQLLIEMAAAAAESDFVVFIDAARDGAPGTVTQRPVLPEPASDDSLTHHLTPETLLAAARLWYGRAPEAALICVGGGDFSHGERLSPPVAAALPELTSRVRALVCARLEASHA